MITKYRKIPLKILSLQACHQNKLRTSKYTKVVLDVFTRLTFGEGQLLAQHYCRLWKHSGSKHRVLTDQSGRQSRSSASAQELWPEWCAPRAGTVLFDRNMILTWRLGEGPLPQDLKSVQILIRQGKGDNEGKFQKQWMYRRDKGPNKVAGTRYIQENPFGTDQKRRMRTGTQQEPRPC